MAAPAFHGESGPPYHRRATRADDQNPIKP